MSADFTNTRSKLARAKEKIDALTREIAGYKSGSVQLVEEVNGYDVCLKSFINHEPDSEWSHDFFEAALQARSALDVMVTQLVIASGNTPKGHTQFPIFRSHDEYVQKRGKRPSFRDQMLRGVDKRFRVIIDRHQPFQRGGNAHKDPLCTLDSVSNFEKHTDMHAVLTAVGYHEFFLIRPDGHRMRVQMNHQAAAAPQPIIDGSIVVGITNQPDPSAPQEHMKIEMSEIDLDVFFGQEGLAFTCSDVERAITHASKVVDRLANAVKP